MPVPLTVAGGASFPGSECGLTRWGRGVKAEHTTAYVRLERNYTRLDGIDAPRRTMAVTQQPAINSGVKFLYVSLREPVDCCPVALDLLSRSVNERALIACRVTTSHP